MNRKILYTLVLLLFFAACKYEDGPIISYNSKYQRLKGEWQIEHLEIDGMDSTQLYIDSCNCNLRFHKEHDYGWGGGQLIDLLKCKPSNWNGANRGYWEFLENKKILYVNLYSTYGYHGIGPINRDDSDWEILRLTNKEFWFISIVQNKKYFFKFKVK